MIGSGQLRILPMTGSAVVSSATGAVLVLLVALIITLGEEIGWRGFMLPRIQQLTGKRHAAVITGLMHGCFHLPLILIATSYQAEGSRWVVAPIQVVMIAATGVFYAWLRDRSGSVWPVVIGHALINTTLVWGLAMVTPTTSTSLSAVAGATGVTLCVSFVMLALLLLRTAKVWKTPPFAVAVPRVDGATRERVEA
jgi:membrane protease YdiL (CAAX protease family)